jgi:hypothetical protein
MSHQTPSPFDRLQPVSDRYATLPVADAFTWEACEADVQPGEWYMVAFRSTRLPSVDEEQLTSHDDWAHPRRWGGGFVHYQRADPAGRGRLSPCLWDCRRGGARRPGGPRTPRRRFTHEAYAEYARVPLVAACGWRLSFEVWDEAQPLRSSNRQCHQCSSRGWHRPD